MFKAYPEAFKLPLRCVLGCFQRRNPDNSIVSTDTHCYSLKWSERDRCHLGWLGNASTVNIHATFLLFQEWVLASAPRIVYNSFILF